MHTAVLMKQVPRGVCMHSEQLSENKVRVHAEARVVRERNVLHSQFRDKPCVPSHVNAVVCFKHEETTRQQWLDPHHVLEYVKGIQCQRFPQHY